MDSGGSWLSDVAFLTRPRVTLAILALLSLPVAPAVLWNTRLLMLR